MADERVVHLALSPRAADDLSKLIDLAYQSFDGTALENFDDPDATWDIFKAIRQDIKDHGRGGKVKKTKSPKKPRAMKKPRK